MKRLTADEVIARAGLVDDRMYMQTDTGAVDTGAGWKETIRDQEKYFDEFETEDFELHLVEVVKDGNGNWIEAE